MPMLGLLGDDPRMMPIPGQPGIGPSLLSPTVPMQTATPPAMPAPVHRSFLDRVMPVPQAYQGLLTEDDIRNARARGLLALGAGLLADSQGEGYGPAPSVGQALAHGIQAGLQSYDQALQGAAQTALGAQQLQRQQALQSARDAIARQFAPLPNETPAQTVARLKGMYAAYVRAGDLDMVAKLGDVLKTIAAPDKAPVVQHIDTGDAVRVIDPTSGRTLQTYPKGMAPQAPNDQQNYQRTQGIAGDFQQATRQFMPVATAIKNIKSLGSAALQGSPAAQMGLIYGYMKLLDPNSSVREGEYATAENAAGVPQKIIALYNRLLDGNFLAPSVVQGFLDSTDILARAWMASFDPIAQQFRERAVRWGVNPNDVIVDYFAGLRTPQGVSGTARKGDANKVRQFLKPR